MVVPDVLVLVILHVILGVAIVGIAYYNFSGVKKTTIAGRVKRTAQAYFNFSIAMLILGLLLTFDIGATWIIPLVNISIYSIVLFIHIAVALAMITQAAAVAIAYDMWEEKEFNEQTPAGSVPPAPKPQPAKSS